MKLPLVLLFVCRTHWSEVVALEVNGEVTFDLKVPLKLNKREQADGWRAGNVPKVRAQTVTAGPRVECIYQYPEQEQINAILSNMMNQLTKVFVRAFDYFPEGDGRRRPETRFRVVDMKKTQFFEHIYHNMTDEFRQFYNRTIERVDRSGRDPCLHQKELKQTWRDLLEHSLATFRRAALHCVKERLNVRKIDDDRFRETSVNRDWDTADDRGQETDIDRVQDLGDNRLRETGDDSIRETGDERIRETGDDRVQVTSDDRVRENGIDDKAAVSKTGDDKVRETGDDAGVSGGRVRETDGDHRAQTTDERTRSHLGQFLMRELAKIRSNQLSMLCENFQLCFNDLL